MPLETLTISLSTMFHAAQAESSPLSFQHLPALSVALQTALVSTLEHEENSLKTLSGLMLRKLPKSSSALLKTVTLTALREALSGQHSFSSMDSSSFSSVSICAASAAELELPSAESVLVFAPHASASSTSLPLS